MTVRAWRRVHLLALALWMIAASVRVLLFLYHPRYRIETAVPFLAAWGLVALVGRGYRRAEHRREVQIFRLDET